MKTLGLFLLLITLTACGSDGSSAPGAPGVFLSSGKPASENDTETLRKTYKWAIYCASVNKNPMSGEPFEALHIEYVDSEWPCGNDMCRGTFIEPNNIKIVYTWVFTHEIFHHFLFVTTGDGDGDHSAPIWKTICPRNAIPTVDPPA